MRYSMVVLDPSELPIWEVCGDAVGLARGYIADIFLHPVAIYPDPFRH